MLKEKHAFKSLEIEGAGKSCTILGRIERMEMVLPPGGLMMNENAASIVAQTKSLIRQLKTKGATDKEKPGKAYIDSKGMLALPDAGNVLIKLNPMERTLHIMFLRYPQEINADELCDIYGFQTVYDDMDLIKDAAEGICDEEKVSWYTKVSRIKRKITDNLGKRTAEHYII